jgi:virginiamycin B lyase
MAQRIRMRWLPTVLVLLLGASSCSPAPGESQPSAQTTTSTISSTPVVTETDVTDAGATSIAVIGGDWLSAGEKGVWLTGPALIYRLDPESGQTVATIDIPENPCEGTAVGLGSVWTATCEKPGLARIDPVTNKVSAHLKLSLPEALGGEASVGVGGGSVWLVVDGPDCTGCRVAQIDPKAMLVLAEIPVLGGSAGVRFGEDAVWVTNPVKNTVTKIDYRLRKVVQTTVVGTQPRFLAVGEGAVWTLNQKDGNISRVDPDTGKVTDVRLGFAGDGGGITTGGGWVWVRGGDQLLARIDPQTNQVVEIYGPATGSGDVVVGFNAVWFSSHGDHTVWRMPIPPS